MLDERSFKYKKKNVSSITRQKLMPQIRDNVQQDYEDKWSAFYQLKMCCFVYIYYLNCKALLNSSSYVPKN